METAFPYTCSRCGTGSYNLYCSTCDALMYTDLPRLPDNPTVRAKRVAAPKTPLRLTHSECNDVYAGNEHYAIQEFAEGEPGLIVADIEEWVDPATAVKLVRAFNAHDDLLEACQRAFHVFENDTPRKREVMGLIEAALAKAA